MLLLGMVTCSLGQAGKDMARHPTTMLLALVGTLALGFAVWAIVTGSLTALSLLAVAIVVLWAGSTVRHAWHPTHRPIPT
jgi:hypothetical protein